MFPRGMLADGENDGSLDAIQALAGYWEALGCDLLASSDLHNAAVPGGLEPSPAPFVFEPEDLVAIASGTDANCVERETTKALDVAPRFEQDTILQAASAIQRRRRPQDEIDELHKQIYKLTIELERLQRCRRGAGNPALLVWGHTTNQASVAAPPTMWEQAAAHERELSERAEVVNLSLRAMIQDASAQIQQIQAEVVARANLEVVYCATPGRWRVVQGALSAANVVLRGV